MDEITKENAQGQGKISRLMDASQSLRNKVMKKFALFEKIEEEAKKD